MELDLNLSSSPQDSSVESGTSNSWADEEGGVIVTRELFPQSKGLGLVQDAASSYSCSSFLVDLSFGGCDFLPQQQQVMKRSKRGLRSRRSQYRGVTLSEDGEMGVSHLGLWEAGLFGAYDRAAIKFRGVEADINFNLSDYDDDFKLV